MTRIQKPSGRRYAKGDVPYLRVDGKPNKVIKHGAFRRSGYHPLAFRWHAMKQRCSNPKWINYRDYGGRGIKVCKRWEKIEHFIEDMGATWLPGFFLERIDNDGDYCPENCRWATKYDQMQNMRSNRLLEFNGKSQTVSQWAKELGVNSRLFRVRLWRGWSVEDTLTLNLECKNTKSRKLSNG